MSVELSANSTPTLQCANRFNHKPPTQNHDENQVEFIETSRSVVLNYVGYDIENRNSLSCARKYGCEAAAAGELLVLLAG